jgi:hypothetical protein
MRDGVRLQSGACGGSSVLRITCARLGGDASAWCVHRWAVGIERERERERCCSHDSREGPIEWRGWGAYSDATVCES